MFGFSYYKNSQVARKYNALTRAYNIREPCPRKIVPSNTGVRCSANDRPNVESALNGFSHCCKFLTDLSLTFRSPWAHRFLFGQRPRGCPRPFVETSPRSLGCLLQQLSLSLQMERFRNIFADLELKTSTPVFFPWLALNRITLCIIGHDTDDDNRTGCEDTGGLPILRIRSY